MLKSMLTVDNAFMRGVKPCVNGRTVGACAFRALNITTSFQSRDNSASLGNLVASEKDVIYPESRNDLRVR